MAHAGNAAGRGGLLARFGPGLVVSAAFIGPGTVTTCSLAGVRRGSGLLWALVFSTVATLVLQEAAARLGVAGRLGLGEALARRRHGSRPLLAWLVVVGIAFGCAAYQGGNLTGAALGLQAAAGGPFMVWVLVLAGAATGFLSLRAYRPVEGVLVGLVVVMGLVFVGTAIAVRPSPADLLRGLVPRLVAGDGVLVLALVGTTVVPYNLFLHAAACREKWRGAADLTAARLDAFLAILLGGVVSAAVLVTGSVLAGGGEPDGAAGLARQLAPLLGERATVLFGVGLFAAGLSSAITAPLAAAYAVSGVAGWPAHGRRFRQVWAVVMVAGVAGVAITRLAPPGSSLRLGPLRAITLAQAANGLLLPLVAVALLLAVNDGRLLGASVNRTGANVAGVAVVLVALTLGGWSLMRAMGLA